MITQSELERLQDKGLIKIPLLVAVLTEAKEKKLSWKFNCEGETFFPEDERLKYVRKVLVTNGFKEPRIIKKFNVQTFNIFPFSKKDPFYCLIATKE